MILMHKPWSRKQTQGKFLRDRNKTIQTFHQMVLITLVVVNLDNMDNDERDHFEAWQYNNHIMTDNRQISDCIDNLNVNIGLDHDWYNSPSNVEISMTNKPKKWMQYAVNECDKVKNKEVTNKEALNILNK